MDLGVCAAVYRTNPNSGCPKRHGSIPANHELQESRAARSGHRKPATGVPKNGAPCCEFQGFVRASAVQNPSVLIESTIAVSSLQTWSFPMFFSHGNHHHAPIHQATLKGTTNKAICEDEPRATPSERSILFFRATSTWAPGGPLDHSWNMNSSLV